MPTRTTARPPSKSFYLGDRDEAQRRVERLDEIATAFGLNKSTLIQQIADGDLLVIHKDQAGLITRLKPSLNGKTLVKGLKVELVETYKALDFEAPAGLRGRVIDWSEDRDGVEIAVLLIPSRITLRLLSPYFKAID